jgi:hypothetical protein
MGQHRAAVDGRPASVTAYIIDERPKRKRPGIVLPVIHAHYPKYAANPNSPQATNELTIAICPNGPYEA